MRLRAILFDILAIFLFVAAVLLGGLAFGRALTSGRAEVADWALVLAVLSILVAGVCWRMRWRRARVVLPWAIIGAVGAVFVFCWVVTDSPLRHSREGGSTGSTRLLPISPISGATRGGQEMGSRLRGNDERGSVDVGVVTSLDIIWRADGGLPPLVRALGKRAKFSAVSQIDDQGLARFSHLLIAQPRLLQPTELVAIDAWVRRGGRAVVLADPWLHWQSDLPPGDRRRPPLTSLLDPLLTHWGLQLEPADMEAGAERRFLTSGALMPVAGASVFRISGMECRAEEGGLMALCRIGRGAVRLIADADMLDDRLWLADSREPANRGAWSGDTPELIAAWLADPLRKAQKSAIPWIIDDRALIAGVRWALILGLGWAVMGAGLFRAWDRLGRTGKKGFRTGKTAIEE